MFNVQNIEAKYCSPSYLSLISSAALSTDFTLLVLTITMDISAPGCRRRSLFLAISARPSLRHARHTWRSSCSVRSLSAMAKPKPLKETQ